MIVQLLGSSLIIHVLSQIAIPFFHSGEKSFLNLADLPVVPKNKGRPNESDALVGYADLI